MTRLRSASRCVGLNPCSTALRRFRCRLAFAGVDPFDLTPCGVDTRTFPLGSFFNFTGIIHKIVRVRLAAVNCRFSGIKSASFNESRLSSLPRRERWIDVSTVPAARIIR